MKKIFFHAKRKSDCMVPFWKPFGFWHYLGKVLLCVLIVALFVFLLSLLHRCDGPQKPIIPDGPEIPEIFHPSPDRQPDTPGAFPIDTSVAPPHHIDDDNLPTPERNRLEPPRKDDIGTDTDKVRRVVGNRLNVILNSDAGDEVFKRWASEFKSIYPSEEYSIVFYDTKTKLIQISVPSAERETVKTTLRSRITDISFMIFDEEVFESPEKFNDPVFSYPDFSWYFEPIQAYEAWEITQGDPNIIIAIVDSYFDLNHDDLNSDRIVAPYSVERRTGNVMPTLGINPVSFKHGSMVASMAAGTANNGVGSTGIAPRCRLMPVSMGETITSMRMLEGILYAIYSGANVINVSAGSSFPNEIRAMPIDAQVEASKIIGLDAEAVWDYVFQLAEERNVTIVWAAGNEDVYAGLDNSKRGENTVRVSAVDRHLQKADFSNFGNIKSLGATASTISAPGVDIFGAMPFNDYDCGAGTSYSAPIVTGAVALIKSLDPTLTNKQIIELLQRTGKPIPGSPTIGPLLQIRAALDEVRGSFARAEDVNPAEGLKGLWQSVELLRKYNIVDGKAIETSDFNRRYFDIGSTTSGQVIIYEATSSKRDYTASITIRRSGDTYVIKQTAEATSPGIDYHYIKASYTIRPGTDGLLECTMTTAYGENTFHLKKIDSRRED